MKKFLTLFSLLCLCTTFAIEVSGTQPSTRRRVGYYGKVRIVDSGADTKLRIVNSNADLDIYPTNGGPKLDALIDKAKVSRKVNPRDLNGWVFGNWKFVSRGEDFTVEFVDQDEDHTVKFIFDTTDMTSLQEINEVSRHMSDSAAWLLAVARAERRAAQEAAWAAEEAPKTAETPTYPPNAIINCKCKGIALYGRVQVVTAGPADFNVCLQDYSADLSVQIIPSNSTPTRCGEWQFVDIAPDFTVKFVTSGEDFSIQYVQYGPGVSVNYRPR